jgi:predicted nucleotidyltransferase
MTLSELERKVLADFRDRLNAELHGEQTEVKLFGSKARGEDREDSDLDVLVIISGDDWHACDRAYDIATDLLLETGVLISPKVISKKQYHQLQEEETPFVRNVIRDSVPI